MPLSVPDESVMIFLRVLLSALSQGCNLKARMKANRVSHSHLNVFSFGLRTFVVGVYFSEGQAPNMVFHFPTWMVSTNLVPTLAPDLARKLALDVLPIWPRIWPGIWPSEPSKCCKQTTDYGR